MKVFDATSIIAFLKEMMFPEGLEALSKHYRLAAPKGVVAEITRSPGKEILGDMIRKNIVDVVDVNEAAAMRIQALNPQLHLGECEIIAFAQSRTEKLYLISDDKVARKKYQSLNFRWTEELMGFMKERGIITEEAYTNKIARLNNSTFFSRSKKK